MEVWKPVSGYEGIYEVSNEGKVKSLSRIDNRGHKRKEKTMKQFLNPRGYLYIVTQGQKSKVVHRLVAEAFLKNESNRKEVNHKNGIKTDNNLSNLEWSTHSENLLHACRTGLRYTPKGEQNHNAVLTNYEAKEIRKLYQQGNTTYLKLAKIFNVSLSVVSNVITNKTYKMEEFYNEAL